MTKAELTTLATAFIAENLEAYEQTSEKFMMIDEWLAAQNISNMQITDCVDALVEEQTNRIAEQNFHNYS